MSKMDGFIKCAQEGAVTVVFKKVNTEEIRTMPCTLNRELSNGNVPEILEQQEVSDHLAVWSLDKDAWRSFRTDTVIEWYKGEPQQEVV